MKRKIITSFLAGVLCCGMLSGCGKNAVDDSNGESLSKDEASGMNGATDITANIPDRITDSQGNPQYKTAQDFAKELFGASLNEKNPVLSPVSAYVALSMAGSGAKGETAAEFQKVFGENSMQISENLMKDLPAEKEELIVKLANSAWIDDGMNVVDDWLSAAKNSFAAKVFQTDLSTERTMRDINWWIQENTAGLIKNFLTKPLDDKARMALFNTVYFKGKWVYPFDAVDTYDRPFTPDDRKVINVSTMNLYRKNLPYIKTDHCEGIVLPYRDSNLVFVALKPTGSTDEKNANGVRTDSALDVRGLYEALNMGQIGTLVDSAVTAKVNLHLPKFEISFDRELNADLVHMGLIKAFDPEAADFSGIGTTKDGEPVFISLVRQKAVFILDEEGTEAAAVTAVVVEPGAAAWGEEEIVELDFNEPFLYLVFDKESDLPLFVGIMDNPLKAEK